MKLLLVLAALAIGPAVNAQSLPVQLSCQGFLPPFDQPIALKANNRGIQLKVVLRDEHGSLVTAADLAFPPVVQVVYLGLIASGTTAIGESLPANAAVQGNQFRYDTKSGNWIYNLSTSAFTAPGTYDVTVVSGDESYAIDPACSGAFVRR
jgi:hypothetical protein